MSMTQDLTGLNHTHNFRVMNWSENVPVLNFTHEFSAMNLSRDFSVNNETQDKPGITYSLDLIVSFTVWILPALFSLAFTSVFLGYILVKLILRIMMSPFLVCGYDLYGDICKKIPALRTQIKDILYQLVHPKLLFKTLMNILKTSFEKSRLEKFSCLRICTEANEEIRRSKNNKVFKSNVFNISVVFGIFYSFLFTIYFCGKLLSLYKTTHWGLFASIMIGYVIYFSPIFLYGVLSMNKIPDRHHLIHREAEDFFKEPIRCATYLKIECYHQESSGDSSYSVTSYSENVRVNVSEWLDPEDSIKASQIIGELKELMIRFPYVQVTPVVKAKPADDSSSTILNKFKHYQIQKNKHMDDSISATFLHKIMMEEKDVDDLVIHREGSEVPSSWLGERFYMMVILLLIAGLPAFAIVPLTLVVKKKNITLKKLIKLCDV